MKLNADLRLTVSTASHCASDMRIIRPSLVMPALFTRMSMRPKSFMIWSMTACVSSKVRCVRGIAFGFHAQRGDFGLGSLAVLVDRKVGERHIGALFGEFECDGLADAACGARYNGHFSIQ